MKFNIECYPDDHINGFNHVMSCKTQEESNTFCKYLASKGLCWKNGKPYLDENGEDYGVWNIYKENTVYVFNWGCIGNLERMSKMTTIVLNFSDFDWSDFENNKEFESYDEYEKYFKDELNQINISSIIDEILGDDDDDEEISEEHNYVVIFFIDDKQYSIGISSPPELLNENIAAMFSNTPIDVDDVIDITKINNLDDGLIPFLKIKGKELLKQGYSKERVAKTLNDIYEIIIK